MSTACVMYSLAFSWRAVFKAKRNAWLAASLKSVQKTMFENRCQQVVQGRLTMSTGQGAFFATARTVLPTMERIRAALGSLAALLAPMTMRSGLIWRA